VKQADTIQQPRREYELLACCARVEPGPAVLERIAWLLGKSLDWQAVVRLAWWHRIRPLTYRRLRAQPEGIVPDEVLAEFAEHARELAQRNVRLAKGLREVTRCCEASSLRTLIFKGPVLARDAYGDPDLRECGDLDLLVHRDDLPRAMERLKSDGYRSLLGELENKRVQQIGASEFQRDGVTFDVHTRLTPWWLSYRIDFDRWWEAGIPLSDGGTHVRKLSPEDTVIVLAIHGTKHWWERLRWVCDIAELVNRGHVTDWDRLEVEAARIGSARTVSLALWLAGDVLAARLPADVRQRVGRSPVVRQLADQVKVWLRHGEHRRGTRDFHDRFQFRLMIRERMRDRVPQFARSVLSRLRLGKVVTPKP